MCAVAHLQCSATLILCKIQWSPARHCCATQADSRLVLLQKHLWRLALYTCVQWPTFWQCHTDFCCCALRAGRTYLLHTEDIPKLYDYIFLGFRVLGFRV